MITLDDVTFGYDRAAPLFEAFSWHTAPGEVWAVLGPSGCGKSTLLLLLAGLLHPQAGEVRIAGERIVRPRPRTGLILQEYGLLPWATVEDNVALGLRVRRFYGPDGHHAPRDAALPCEEIAARVAHWLTRLDIAPLANQYPAQLSGGQRQRVAIARTLALHPDLLLMDEPFGALDAPTREQLQHLALSLCAEAGLTVVLVTHNINEAAFVGQKILLLGGPPHRAATVFEHPHPAEAAYRETAAYRATCARLREAVGQSIADKRAV